MSYVRVIARRGDGLEVEFEWDGVAAPIDRDGSRCAEQIQLAADKAKAAITSRPNA